ncbi:MAG: MBL fold metallo-hydrolase [Deltaproteobacteria bacterium]
MIALNLGGLDIRAYSVGGVETCFVLPRYDVCLDIGRCPRGAERQGHLLLTHAHIDHAAGLPYYVSLRALMSMKPPRVACPEASAETLKTILDTWATLQADSDRLHLVAVKPGDRIPLKHGAYAVAYRSPHRIACVGYTIYSTKKKLKDELAGLPGEEIAKRARAGEEVNTVTESAEVSFPGDTRIEVVETEPSVRTAKVLILESTFVGDSIAPEKAKRTGHVHLDQIAERADLFENEHILLTHFSRRHSAAQIHDEAKKKLPPHLYERVTLLVHEG